MPWPCTCLQAGPAHNTVGHARRLEKATISVGLGFLATMVAHTRIHMQGTDLHM